MPMKSDLLRIDNIAIVVEKLEAAKAFFIELGMELEGQTTVEGTWVDQVIGLKNASSEIAMMRTPNGQSRIELTKFNKPKASSAEAHLVAVNTPGNHRIMFAVSNINEVIERLKKHGATVVDQVVQYKNSYLLCYLRGPEGIIIALAEDITQQQ